jgi:hypothetical protein
MWMWQVKMSLPWKPRYQNNGVGWCPLLLCNGNSSYYYSSLFPFFPRTMNLSTADLRNYWTESHETWWSYRYIFLVGPKALWYRGSKSYFEVLIFCRIVVAILKLATGRNFSMSGIYSGHHYLPTYQFFMIWDNVEYLRYYGGHFENGDR